MDWVRTANKWHLNSTLQFTEHFHIHCVPWSLEQACDVHYLWLWVQRHHVTCPSPRVCKPQSPDFHRVSRLWISCSFFDKIFDLSHLRIFVFGLRKNISWYFQCRFWYSWESFWDKMNFRITSTAMESVILFQDFVKEIKLFIWNAWYRKCNSCKELFIWDHLTMCCDRKILE